MILASGFEDTRFGFVGGLILVGFIFFGIVAFAFYLISLVRGLTNRETRSDTVKEIKESVSGVGDAVKFMASDQGFHKELKKEFRPTLILLAVLAVVLVVLALTNIDEW